MLMELLEKERYCAFHILVCYPLGAICFLIDVLGCGVAIEEAKAMLAEYELSDEAHKLLKNHQLMELLSRQYSQIKDIKTVTLILCALIFHRVPRDLVSLLNNQECA